MSKSSRERLKQNENIFLTGFSGCGKSSVGPVLAKTLKALFVDTDSHIVKQSGLSINDLFAQYGETEFRKIETEVLTKLILALKRQTVFALGGGTLLNAKNRQIVAEHGILIYLRCSVKELCKRLSSVSDRPLLSTADAHSNQISEDLRQSITDRLAERIPNYRTAAITVSTTDRTISETVEDINRRLRNLR